MERLEKLAVPGFDQHLKIHVTGCPNSCGQHWIADIGIEGKKTKVEGTMVDAYYFCVGGAVGQHQRTARPVGYRAPVTEVPDAIERLLRAYRAERRDGDSPREFTTRHTDDELRRFLAGETVAAVERDSSPGIRPTAWTADDSGRGVGERPVPVTVYIPRPFCQATQNRDLIEVAPGTASSAPSTSLPAGGVDRAGAHAAQRSGSIRPPSANPFLRSAQLSQRPQARPSRVGS